MPTKNKCEGCRFFKVHSLFTEKGADKIGATCEITNKHTKLVIGNKVVDFDLQRQCPLKKVIRYEQLKQRWKEFTDYVVKIECDSKSLVCNSEKLLTNIINKVKEIEKRENVYEQQD